MNNKVKGALVVLLALLIMAAILIAVSLEKLDNKEVGIQYDTVQKELGDDVFTEGLHTGPPGFEFIIFPNVFTTMNFNDIECLNKDGVTIDLSVSYQYRIQMKKLRDIILQFKDFDGYKEVLIRIGLAVVYEACSKYNTSQFQTMRSEFENQVSTIMTERYVEVATDVEGLQINNIDRPKLYENAIKQKERAKEDIQVAKQERPRKETEAKTLKREAESEADIILQKAESDARILDERAQSEAQAIKEQYEKEAEAYSAIMDASGLGFSPEAFVSYMGVRVISDAKNPVYIGLNSPAKSSFVKN